MVEMLEGGKKDHQYYSIKKAQVQYFSLLCKPR